jgi:hypothetical protein
MKFNYKRLAIAPIAAAALGLLLAGSGVFTGSIAKPTFRLITISVFGLLLLSCTAAPGLLLAISDVPADQVANEPTDQVAAVPTDQVATISDSFRRIPFDQMMSTGQSVANDCQDPEANHPYLPYDWPDASATLTLKERDGQSSVAIDIENARPNTHYTVWLRLRGEDSNGNTFGGSPLTGIPGTPLIPSSELGTALSQLPGTEDELNGFYTDDEGTARFEIDLDFPIINGAYPFQKFTDFDPSDERYPIDDPQAIPMAIIGPNGPFTLRIASHCTDGLGHGLLPGPHEGWFDWSFTP